MIRNNIGKYLFFSVVSVFLIIYIAAVLLSSPQKKPAYADAPIAHPLYVPIPVVRIVPLPYAAPEQSVPEQLIIEPYVAQKFTNEDINIIAKLVYGEARGCSPEEQALVVWTIINRVEAGMGSIIQVSTGGAFYGYRRSNPVTDSIKSIVIAEFNKWQNGQRAPMLYPYATTQDYKYFSGDGRHNWFRDEY